ncbi:hypothetical protein AVEN_151398-1 [Araneus ventricosus]|uniref:Uncharacterized protein n=1 Tax=Araneus ventricosus TaxID=182803 RepID=A0A4Y2CC98_ARAVE|nr:hypothetical protein AVEN_151398-1 [Araneus ventricosus]
MSLKDKRSKRARDAAELTKQYEISETFPNSADLLNEIQQLQMQVEVLKNCELPQPSSKIDPNIASDYVKTVIRKTVIMHIKRNHR